MRINDEDSKKNLIFDVILKWVVDIILVVVFALFIINYYGESAVVSGNSMNPIVENEEMVLLDQLSYELKEPKRFDVIAYVSRSGDVSIKRIIGLPGETVQIIDNTIYIDGEEIEDKYFEGKFESGYVDEAIVIGDNEYFVMGDNRNVSEDSRFEYVGNISREDILGKIWFVCYPFNKLRML